MLGKVLFSPLHSWFLGPGSLVGTLSFPPRLLPVTAFPRILGLSLRRNRMSMSTPLCHPKGHFFLLLRIASCILLGPIHPLVVKGEG